MKGKILTFIFMLCATVAYAQNHKANYSNIDKLIEEIAEEEEYAEYSFISKQMITKMEGIKDSNVAKTIDYIKSVHNTSKGRAEKVCASPKTMNRIKDVCDKKLNEWNFKMLMDNRDPSNGTRHVVCCYYGEGGLNYLVSIKCNFLTYKFNISAFVGAGNVQDMLDLIN